jgi:N-carbamoylputrescine amidase
MKTKIALLQFSMTDSLDENRKKAVRLCHQAAQNGAQILCLPEMFASLYFCQEEHSKHFDLAEALEGPSMACLSEVAKAEGVVIVIPIFEKRAPGVYHNSVVVVGPIGETLGVYRKMHIPDDPGFYEKYYFAPGDLGFEPIDTPFGKLGILICWDQWYPEAARLMTLKGADVLIYPTAIGWHPDEKERYGVAQHEAWKTVQRGHAIANGIYVAAINRVGLETPAGDPGLEFWGRSFACDPQGVVLVEAGQAEEILYTQIDTDHTETIRRNWPFLRDRRIDAFGEITKRWVD